MRHNMNLKDMVKDNKRVHFQFYRSGELWYTTECGFEFPVPTSDCGDAVFLAEDKALLFMRYIRKHIEAIKQAKEDAEVEEWLNSPPVGREMI
jgi:hypothetical protein